MNPPTTTIKGTFSFQQWYPFGENIRKKSLTPSKERRWYWQGMDAMIAWVTRRSLELTPCFVVQRASSFMLYSCRWVCSLFSYKSFFLPVYYLKGLAGLWFQDWFIVFPTKFYAHMKILSSPHLVSRSDSELALTFWTEPINNTIKKK